MSLKYASSIVNTTSFKSKLDSWLISSRTWFFGRDWSFSFQNLYFFVLVPWSEGAEDEAATHTWRSNCYFLYVCLYIGPLQNIISLYCNLPFFRNINTFQVDIVRWIKERKESLICYVHSYFLKSLWIDEHRTQHLYNINSYFFSHTCIGITSKPSISTSSSHLWEETFNIMIRAVFQLISFEY